MVGSYAGYRGAGKVTGEEIGMFAAKRDDGSDGRALGMEAEMIVPFRLDDHFVQRDACRCQSEIPPPPIVDGGMVQLLQRTARRRAGGDVSNVAVNIQRYEALAPFCDAGKRRLLRAGTPK